MTKAKHMSMEQLLEYIWVPIIGAFGIAWTRLTGHGTRLSLLEQAKEHQHQQREEEKALRDSQRLEIFARLEAHHKIVMSKLEHMEDRLNDGVNKP